MTRQVERHQSFLGRKRINRVYSRENRHFLRRGRAQHSNIVVLIVTVHFRLLPHSPLVPWGGSKEGDGNGNDGVRAVIQSSCSSTSPLSFPIPHTRHPLQARSEVYSTTQPVRQAAPPAQTCPPSLPRANGWRKRRSTGMARGQEQAKVGGHIYIRHDLRLPAVSLKKDEGIMDATPWTRTGFCICDLATENDCEPLLRKHLAKSSQHRRCHALNKSLHEPREFPTPSRPSTSFLIHPGRLLPHILQ